MPPSCCVYGCSGKNPEGKYFRRFSFPKDPVISLKWMYLCGRKDNISSSGRVCERHFSRQQYARDLRHELLGIPTPKNKRPLKCDAFPDTNLPPVAQREDIMESSSEFEEVTVKEEPIDNQVSSSHLPTSSQQPSAVDSVNSHSGDALSQCDMTDVKEEDVWIKDDPIEYVDLSTGNTATTSPKLKSELRSTSGSLTMAGRTQDERDPIDTGEEDHELMPMWDELELLDDLDTEIESVYDSDAMEEYVPSKEEEEEEEDEEEWDLLTHRTPCPRRQHSRGSSRGSANTPRAVPALSDMPPPLLALPDIPSTSSALHDLPANSSATSLSHMAGKSTQREREGPPQNHVHEFKESQLRSKDGTLWCTKPLVQSARLQHHNQPRNYSEGPTVVTQGAATPVECLHLFLDDSFYSTIVKHTNAVIDILSQRISCKRATFSRTTEAEVKALVGILLLSGSQQDNHITTSELWDHRIGAPLYRAAMNERRFCFLLRCLRFDDKTTRQERVKTDRFAPIRILWDNFIEKCKMNYIPDENITVDEQLLGFRGRCAFRMYIANKPAKCGLKIIMANDSKTSYLLNAMPYLGKDSQRGKVESLGQYYTMELMRPYLGQYRSVTADSWFMSLSLAKSLLEEKTTAVGTLHKKPYVPEKMTELKKERPINTSAFLYSDKIMLLSFKPKANKIVVLLTSKHHKGSICEDGKAEVVHFYNSTKGGTDTFDQMCQQYSCSRKTKRWPLCMYYGIINAASINSYIIYSRKCSDRRAKKMERRCFMQEAAYELVKPWAQQRLTERRLPRQIILLIRSVFGWEAPVFPTTSGHEPKKRKRCELCSWTKDNKTASRCLYCNRSVCRNHFVHVCSDCL